MARLSHWRGQGRDLVELILLPGLAAILPWKWCFAVYRRVSAWPWLYRDACETALLHARRLGWAGDDEAEWLRARRLVTLVDHADLFLARTRSNRYLQRHVDVDGHWPPPGSPAVLCTFHWGAGMWGLRHLGASGLRAHPLVAPLRREHFAARPLAFHVFSARNASVRQAVGVAPLDVSASLRPALKALKAAEQVVAAVDVPSDQVTSSTAIDFLGHRARVPRGLLRVAVERSLPVTLYLTGLRRDTGRRSLRIHQIDVGDDVDALIRRVFAVLEDAVREDPPAWHFWAVADRFFEAERSATQAPMP